MSKHTPGPWALETVATSAGICHKIGLFPGRDDDRPSAACVYVDGIRLGIDERLPRAQELLANARLIAAAPDLLFALTQWRDHVRRHLVGQAHPIEQRLLDMADAAIAKAEGRS